MASLKAHYAARLAEGAIAPDPAQQAGLEALARLEQDLTQRPLLGWRRKPPRGVYLYGPPGRGKTMIADLFFEAAPAPKARFHFHAFMARVHGLIREWREGDHAARRARFGSAKGDDPIPPTARLVLGGARLLVFDEMQVTDIADAMILGRLFDAMLEEGVAIVATSNRPPDDLYLDGINRQLFLPFIAELKTRLEVVAMAGATDWRLDRLRSSKRWFISDAEGRAGFDRLWKELVGVGHEQDAQIEVLGRRLDFERTAGSALRASFSELCEAMLGPQDYLALAGQFSTLFLEDVPRLVPDKKEAARRLVTLIDTLYEARTRLIVLAEAEPDTLYPAGVGAFEFERTVSRLEEMRSDDWLAATPTAATPAVTA
ncbi:MAG: cell division protein ZapE [Caulobacteraceae bacterium]|nr:cell division protein ZapE [Caulobacteraceae bacterium]